MGNFFFEQSSRVSKVGLWVKRNSLAGWAKKRSVTQPLTAPGLVIGLALVHLKQNWWGGVAQPQVVFGVESGLSTVHFPVGQWTANFQCELFSFSFFLFLVQGGGLKAKSSQVSDMFPKEFPIALGVFRVTLCVPAIDYS